MKLFLQLLLFLWTLMVVWCHDENPEALNRKHLHTIMSVLDKSLDPCTEFYQYVCSNWLDNHKEYSDQYYTVGEALKFHGNLEILEYLEKTPADDMPEFVKALKTFHGSCVEREVFELEELMRTMEKEEKITWALLTPQDGGQGFNWPSTLAQFRKYGFNDMFISYSRKFQDATTGVTYLNRPDYEKKFNYLNSYQLNGYNESIPLPEGTLSFEELWKLVDRFEDKLREIPRENVEARQFKFHELPYDWLGGYLTSLMHPQDVDENMVIGIDNVAYMEALDKLLKEYDQGFLCRYLELRFLNYMEMANKRHSSHECLTTGTSFMPLAGEWIYGQLHPEIASEIPKIQQMFENTVRNINKTLHGTKSPLIPKEFFRQLETMQLKIGMLSEGNPKEHLENYYSGLKLQSHDYYGNYLKLLEFHYQLENAENRKEFKYDAEIAPIYVETSNTLQLPLGLLRPPVYHAAFEDIFKQSSLAHLMAMGIFEAFPVEENRGIDANHIQKIAGLASLHSAFEIFFSSAQPEEILRYQTLFQLTSLEQIKQIFFINAIHQQCEWYFNNVERVNFVINNLSDFIETFDCKFNGLIKMF